MGFVMENNRWDEEYKELELGDKRLETRLYKMMESIWKTPDKTIHLSSGGRNEAKAAYRFLSNEKAEISKIASSVKASTAAKIKKSGESVILSIQDTTSLSYSEREKIEGMGYYCDSETKGMNVHTAIALTRAGLPLGVLHQEYHTREEKKQQGSTKEQRQFRPIEEKESYQWLNSMKESRTGIPETVKLIHVCDREGDIYELFDIAEKENEIFLVRILHNRLTVDSKRVMDELEQKETDGTLLVKIARNPKEHTPSRTVLMNFTYGEYEIKCPHRRKESHISKSLRVKGIYVCESGKSKNKAIRWFLLTNDSIENNNEAIEMIRNYTQRWKIERFHYVLKSGCSIERKQSRTYKKLCLLTLLYSVIAMMILNMTYFGRLFPDMPCDVFFDENEWKVLYCIANKVKFPPTSPYSISQAISYIAVLGGGIPAPSDGTPGVKTLWLGLQKLFFAVDCFAFLW